MSRRKSNTLLPSLSEWRESRGLLALMPERPGQDALWTRAKNAARLELRGAMYSPDDREDVAASIVAAVLEETGGSAPRAESPRVKLGRLCGDAKNLRRSIDARRERDRIDAETRAAEHALTADALGADVSPAAHVAIVQRSGAKLAASAASAVCEQLGLPADEDSPAWAVFYVWTRGLSPEQCAAERDVTWGAWRVRMTRGAKFVRGFYSARELVARLTLGATLSEDGELVYVARDDSREAHGRTPMLAPDWRSDGPASECVVHRGAVAKVHWTHRAERRSDRAQELAASMSRLARAHALEANRRGARERPAKRRSDLAK